MFCQNTATYKKSAMQVVRFFVLTELGELFIFELAKVIIDP